MAKLIMIKALLQLCKFKVVLLILLTAIVGMFLSVPHIPDLFLVMMAILGIGFAASSAAVFNHILDQKIDKKMLRTSERPLVKGVITQNQSLIWGIFLGTLGIMILFIWVNSLTALLTFVSVISYAIFYTVYLKHATPQNIVIGGAAGATPPILGWTAITSEIHAYSLLLFLIIFVWTPPHFWALAIYKHEEYVNAKVPMLPVTHGLAFTKLHILLYTILLFIVTLMPYLSGMSGFIYLTITLILNSLFLYHAVKVYLAKNKEFAFNTFIYSINYLLILFLALLIDHYLIFTFS